MRPTATARATARRKRTAKRTKELQCRLRSDHLLRIALLLLTAAPTRPADSTSITVAITITITTTATNTALLTPLIDFHNSCGRLS